MSDYALDDAAAAALWALRRAPVEHIGLLYSQADAVRATPTATRDDAGRTKGTFAIPKGSLRGVFHNHPSRQTRRDDLRAAARDAERAKFSHGDRKEALRLGVPSYIAAGPKLRRYDPDTGKTTDVLAQIPIDEIRQQIMTEILRRDPNDPRGARR